MKPRNRRPPPPKRAELRRDPAPAPRRGPAAGVRRDPPVKAPNLIYGVSPVLEALRAEHRRIDKILVAENAREHRLSEILDECRSRSIPWQRASRDAFLKLAGTEVNHQGVIAFTASAEYVDTDEIFQHAAETPLILILDGVEDPRNLGAILRTAEGAGVDGIVIPERRAVGLTDTVAKSSAGAIEYVRVAKTTNLNRFIEELKSRDVWVVGTSADAATSYDQWDWTRPSALILGGEGSGLHRLVAENCDVLVKIPMYGKIDSLNVSVAAGVILFEAQRQRRKDF